MNKRAVVLIFAFIFLILLSIISIFYIYMTHTYSNFAANYQIDLQAEFFAKSGIEKSITKLYNQYKEGNIKRLFKPIFNPQIYTTTQKEVEFVATAAIEDLTGKININSRSEGIRNALNNLSDILKTKNKLGDAIFSKNKHYQVLEELKTIVGEGDYKKVESFITSYS